MITLEDLQFLVETLKALIEDSGDDESVARAKKLIPKLFKLSLTAPNDDEVDD